MTDKPKDEIPSVIPSESVENVEELGKGNNSLLPIFESVTSNQVFKTSSELISSVESLKLEASEIEKLSESAESTTESHMVMYKGALIDVEKLLQQLNRSERAREETEWRLSELNKTYGELQSSNSKAKDKIKDLQSELKNSNRKMGDIESSLSCANVSLFNLGKEVLNFINNA